MKPIIEPTTDAASQSLPLGAGIMTISAGKLATTETVTFQLSEEDVETPGDLYQNGEIRQLTATHNAMLIEGPVNLIVTKSATAAAVGVYGKK